MKARARLAATLQLGLGLVALVLETVRVSSTFHEVTLSTFGEGFYCGAAFLAAGLLHLLLLGGDKQLHQVGRDDNSRNCQISLSSPSWIPWLVGCRIASTATVVAFVSKKFDV